MKKVVVSSNRVSREQIANPYQNIKFKDKILKSACSDFTKGSKIIDCGNGFSKIVSKSNKTK